MNQETAQKRKRAVVAAVQRPSVSDAEFDASLTELRQLAKIKLPNGKKLIPGAVTHSNVTIEHPEVVADRMRRWIEAAGAQNVMFGNDCGFSSTAGNTEIPETVAWAKLKALADGARIAASRLS